MALKEASFFIYMSKTAWIWTAIIVVVVAAGLYWYMSMPAADDASSTLVGEQSGTVNDDQDAPGPETVPSGTATGGVGVEVDVDTTPTTATVTYNGSGYSPSSVTIKQGGTVTWNNTSSGSMWVASASHPTHTVYDGTSRAEHCAAPSATTFDQCKGESGSYSFTFTKAGKWNYHDHMNSSVFGSVTVVE